MGDVNALNEDEWAHFHMAIKNGNQTIVDLLLQVEAIDLLALLWAARNGHTETVKLLIEAGANIIQQITIERLLCR